MRNPRELFGDIDIYLFDQLLKGRITENMRILDAGCGSGRNLTYFLRSGYEVYAIDRSEEAIQAVRKQGEQWAPAWSSDRARVESIEKMSFANDSFDVVLCNAVLHFAMNEAHFQQMLHELWRVLRPGGLLFVRLASSIGIEARIEPLGDYRYKLPDGSIRFLVDEERLLRTTEKLQGILLEPIKTVNVANQRCMTTWCVKKPHILFFDPIEETVQEKDERDQLLQQSNLNHTEEKSS